MSLMSPSALIDRIRSATPESPVAVFKHARRGVLDAYPANTVLTQRKIELEQFNLVGVFSADDVDNIKREIHFQSGEGL